MPGLTQRNKWQKASSGNRLAIVLHRHHVLEQMHLQRQLERAGLRLVIYRLHCGNRGCRRICMFHSGRQCGTRVRPVSALMFSNKSQPAPVGTVSSAARLTSHVRRG